MASLLLIILFLPLAGAVLVHGDHRRARGMALIVALATLAVTADLAARFPAHPSGAELNAETIVPWLDWAGATIFFSIALDGLSLWLVALTALLSVAAVLVGWEAIRDRAALYYRLLLVLETGLLGVFAARDLVLFYVFFEFTLVPLFFLIGLWGGPERRRAAAKFFLFTLAGSMLTLLGLLAIVLWTYFQSDSDPALRTLTFSISDLTESLRIRPMDPTLQLGVFLALFAGFAIKTPLWPLHTWLPLAHVEAPTAGSVLLAGVLLKVGMYGFLRFNVPMLPHATATLMPWLMWLSLAGVLYGALVALAQSDIKRLVAYSSVSHLGLCMLGVFALTPLSLAGGSLQMVSHGLATGGLFAVVGMIYERFHTREIADLGGLARRMPRLAAATLVFVLSSIALPCTAGFAGEFPLLAGVFQRGWAASGGGWQLRAIAVLSFGGVILGAWYMLWMYQRVFFGPMGRWQSGAAKSGDRQSHPAAENAQPAVKDLSLREIACLVPLVAAIVWIGVQPRLFFDRMTPALDDLAKPAMEKTESSNLKSEISNLKSEIVR
jgi:NADH-quinone oxidoreductase subunit M